MIFVTVGNARQGFGRLLEAVESLTCSGLLGEDNVLIQSGNNYDFKTSQCIQEKFFSGERFVEIIEKSDLIISHAGAGTLLHILRAGKLPVVMPRRAKYGEHVDDHQVELVQALAFEGRIIPAYEAEDLPGAIVLAQQRRLDPRHVLPSHMLSLVSETVQQLLQFKI